MSAINETRVFGPPGTGKTTYVTKQITLAAEQFGAENILVASFTRAAAHEIAGRGQAIHPNQIGTLHAHCYRLLGSPQIAEANCKAFNEEYPHFAITQAKEDVVDDGLTVDMDAIAGSGDDLLAEYNILRARMVKQELWAPTVAEFAIAWERYKSSCGYCDFQDLIDRAGESYYPPNNATIGVFDEVQDFTPSQLRLIRSWGKQMHWIMLSGDDDQTIYSFTGASPNAFLNPPIPQEFKRILTQSYRVPRKIQALAAKIVAKLDVREPKEYKPRDYEGTIYTTQATCKKPDQLVAAVKKYVNEDKSVMILASCSYMLVPMITALRNAGIPFSNAYKASRGDWNPIRSGKGSSFGKLCAYMHPEGSEFNGYKLWTIGQLASWASTMKADGIFTHGGKKIIQDFAKSHNTCKTEELLGLMLATLTPESFDSAFTLSSDWFCDNIVPSKLKSFEFPKRIYSSFGKGAATLASKVTIGTIHSVKGAEADVVIVFPDLSVRGAQAYLQKSGENYNQILRLFYVAVTRARDTVILANGLSSGQFFNDYK